MDGSQTDARAKLWDMIKDIRVAMLVTMEQDGSHRARPMWTIEREFDGTLWFFTHASSETSGEVRASDQVCLCYSEPEDQNYVSISGRAQIVRDQAEIDRHWSEYMATWFPKGTSDPDIALIAVTVDRAEYWDAPSSTMVHAYGYLKAKLTGKSPEDVGENRKLDF